MCFIKYIFIVDLFPTIIMISAASVWRSREPLQPRCTALYCSEWGPEKKQNKPPNTEAALISDYGREQTDYRYVLYMTPLQKTQTIPLRNDIANFVAWLLDLMTVHAYNQFCSGLQKWFWGWLFLCLTKMEGYIT